LQDSQPRDAQRSSARVAAGEPKEHTQIRHVSRAAELEPEHSAAAQQDARAAGGAHERGRIGNQLASTAPPCSSSMQQDSQQANEILIQQSIQQYHENKITNKTIHQAAKQASKQHTTRHASAWAAACASSWAAVWAADWILAAWQLQLAATKTEHKQANHTAQHKPSETSNSRPQIKNTCHAPNEQQQRQHISPAQTNNSTTCNQSLSKILPCKSLDRL
jgi:hypothetical protein